MDALLQGIKILDQVTFQQLCFQLMSEKYPTARIRYVEGAAGDEGADLFTGDLSMGPTVWQCKAFQVTVIRDSQKQQIRESLRSAVKKLSPKLWILCLNMNLDTKAFRWFQRLQKTYASKGVMIADPIQGLDLARELLFRKTILEHYFPNVALDVGGIRALIGGIADLDDTSLQKRAAENVEQWLTRIQAKDARFTYELTFGGDRGPVSFPPPAEPGLVLAMTDGRKTVKAFVRDAEALRLDPIGFKMRLSGKGVDKFRDLVRTGRRQVWDNDDIREFASTMPLLSEVDFRAGKLQVLMESAPGKTNIPLRLAFRTSNSSVTFDYVEFEITRGGTHEVELKTKQGEALAVSLVLPVDGSLQGRTTIGKRFVGKRVKDVAKVISALRLVQSGCEIELFALKAGAQLGVMSVAPIDLRLKPGFFSFVDDLAKIAERFQADLVLPNPDKFTRDDEEAFSLLRAFALNQPIVLKQAAFTIVKSFENAELLPKQLTGTGAFRAEHEEFTAVMFGTEIRTGPCAMQMDKARVKDLSKTLSKFKRARIGEGVRVVLHPLTPVKFELLTRQQLLRNQ